MERGARGGIRSAAGGRYAVCPAPARRHHPTPPPLREGRPPSPPSAALPTPLCKQVSTPFRRAAFVGGTRRAVQRSAQFGVAVSAVQIAESWAASATRGLPLRAAALCRLPPPSVPSHPLLCDGLEAGVPTCGGSQALQRGKLPKLRGQAAAQVVVVVKEPVRGAPEREIMGERRRVLPLPATIPSAPPHPLSCRHGLEAGVQSCGGSHGRHRGELPDLRGYAAGQVVADQVPARGAPEREIMGERRRTQRVASATRAAAPTRRHPPYLSTLYPVPRLGGGGGARCGGSHCRKLGKHPDLRGDGSGQAAVKKLPARGPPEGSRGVPVGASDPRRAADARCASPYATPPPYATTPTRVPPSVPSRRRSPNPCKQVASLVGAWYTVERTRWGRCRCRCRSSARGCRWSRPTPSWRARGREWYEACDACEGDGQ